MAMHMRLGCLHCAVGCMQTGCAYAFPTGPCHPPCAACAVYMSVWACVLCCRWLWLHSAKCTDWFLQAAAIPIGGLLDAHITRVCCPADTTADACCCLCACLPACLAAVPMLHPPPPAACLQATDDSMKGGLMTTMSDLKQLLIGAVLWNPIVFHTVSAHHLVSGEPVSSDPEHSEATMSGVCLDAKQNEVLLIIAGEMRAARLWCSCMRMPVCLGHSIVACMHQIAVLRLVLTAEVVSCWTCLLSWCINACGVGR